MGGKLRLSGRRLAPARKKAVSYEPISATSQIHNIFQSTRLQKESFIKLSHFRLWCYTEHRVILFAPAGPNS